MTVPRVEDVCTTNLSISYFFLQFSAVIFNAPEEVHKAAVSVVPDLKFRVSVREKKHGSSAAEHFYVVSEILARRILV